MESKNIRLINETGREKVLMDALTLYRKIGSALHQIGAYRAVIVKSKAMPDRVPEMSLEIAVDGNIDVKKAAEQCRQQFPEVQIILLDLAENTDMELMQEIIEDGIQI